MAKGIEWLKAQNAKRAAAAKSKRIDRGGEGRALARRAWVARRFAARLAARRRKEVVGRVRLWGKGPPPRLGPLNKWPRPPPEEPFEDSMMALVEHIWAQEDKRVYRMHLLTGACLSKRKPAGTAFDDFGRGWGRNGL